MTVDRGGLQYNIQTTGDFTALNQFSSKLASVKKDLAEIKKQNASVSKSTKASTDPKQRSAQAKKLSDIEKRQLSISKQRAALRSTALRREGELLAREKKRAAINSQMRAEGDKRLNQMKASLTIKKAMNRLEIRSQTIGNKELSDKRAQVSAERQIAAYREKQAKFATLASFARSQGLTGNAQALSELGFSKGRAQGAGLLPKDAILNAEKMKGVLKKVGGIADRVTASITRMFTALVFFTAARQFVQGIKDMIVGMIKFNSVLEQTKLGIASLIIASGSLVTAQGKMLEGPESLAAAQKMATVQVKQLRKEALRTAATFEDLSQAFQVSVAPGLQAGLSLDEVREFTVRISQAAATLGLQQNQLAEEIRSVLQGTITARTTRIATALGIRNEDIRNAKEMGKLSEFLVDKFSAFKLAADETLHTFQAIYTNLKDAFMLVAGEGGIGLFNELKKTMNEIKDIIVSVGDEGIIADPRAVAAFEEFAGSLSRILNEWTGAFGGDAMSVLENTLKGISKTLETISEFVLGITDGVKLILKLIPDIGIGSNQVARGLGLVLAVVTALKLVRIDLLVKLVSMIGAGSFIAGMKAMSLGLVNLVRVNLFLTTIIVLLGVAFKLFQDIGTELGEINGQTASWSEMLKIFQAEASNFLVKLQLKISHFFKKIPLNLKATLQGLKAILLTWVENLILKIVDAALSGFDKLKKQFPKSFRALQKGLKAVGLGGFSDLIGADKESLTKSFNTYNSAGEAAWKAYDKTLKKLEDMKKKHDADLLMSEKITQAEVKQTMREFAKRAGGTLAVDLPGGGLEGRRTTESRAFAADFLASSPTAIGTPALQMSEKAAQKLKRDNEVELSKLGMARLLLFKNQRKEKELMISMAREERVELEEVNRHIEESNVKILNQKRALATLTDTLTLQELQGAEDLISLRQDLIEDEVPYKEMLEQEAHLLRSQAGDMEKIKDAAKEIEQRRATIAAAELTITKDLESRQQIEKSFNKLLETRLALLREESGETKGMIEGIKAGIIDFLDELPNRYQATLNVVKSATNGLVGAISGSITDALDPSKSSKDLKDRWRKLGKDIADSMLQEILKNAIKQIGVNLATSLFSSGSGVSSAGSASGVPSTMMAATGGYVQGFAGGGSVLGTHSTAGKDPRDTVPAWLRPGEYVVRPEIVRSLGTGFFNAINDGMLSPFLNLSGLTGLSKANSLPGGPSGNSFATGGRVSGGSPTGGNSSQIMVVPVMIANDQNAEQLFNGGSQAFRRSMMANQDAMKTGRQSRPRSFNE